jgi:tetratricopeptide (TPR) repeat protein
MARITICALVCFVVGCAVPRDNGDFSVWSADNAQEFLSSSELRTSGLVSESIRIAAKGRLFDAESRLRKALLLSPASPSIQYNLAVVLGQQGYAEEAKTILEGLKGSQGDHPRYAMALADVYAGKGDLVGAREQLKLAFGAFIQAHNWLKAALVARSISNLAFADGAEQEALCYSYEALFLEPSAAQLGFHTSILVGLNQYVTADTYVGEQLALNPALGASPRVHLFRALARAALGNLTGAVNEIETAQDLLAQDPELGAEVNVVWWLLKKQLPQTQEDLEDDTLQESLEAAVPEVVRLKDKPTYGMVRWPRYALNLLSTASLPEELK